MLAYFRGMTHMHMLIVDYIVLIQPLTARFLSYVGVWTGVTVRPERIQEVALWGSIPSPLPSTSLSFLPPPALPFIPLPPLFSPSP